MSILEFKFPQYNPSPAPPMSGFMDEYNDWVSFEGIYFNMLKRSYRDSWRVLHLDWDDIDWVLA